MVPDGTTAIGSALCSLFPITLFTSLHCRRAGRLFCAFSENIDLTGAPLIRSRASVEIQTTLFFLPRRYESEPPIHITR